MGQHRLNYMVTLRRSRSRVIAVVVAVGINLFLLFILVLATVVLLAILQGAMGRGLADTPWAIVLILLGVIAACVWGGIAGVMDTYRTIRKGDENVDFAGPEQDDAALAPGERR